VADSEGQLVYVTLNLAGADQRQDDLFMNESIFSRGKSALKGLKVSAFNSRGMPLTVN
jgi:vacuolar protein sorting-associated protein 45